MNNLREINVVVKASEASVSDLGAGLGQYGFSVMQFCKEFNERSVKYRKGTLLSVSIFLKSNMTITFEIKKVVGSFLILSLFNSKGFITLEDIYKIALIMQYPNKKKSRLKSDCKNLLSVLNSMKILIKKEYI